MGKEIEEYSWKDNMHVINAIITEIWTTYIGAGLVIEQAEQYVMLRMFPVYDDKTKAIEYMWKEFLKEHPLKELEGSFLKR